MAMFLLLNNPVIRIALIRFSLLLLLASRLLLSLHSQEVNQSYYSADSASSLSKGVSLKILNNNFLRNNEYFNPYTEGMTYFGSVFQPEITYAFNSQLSFSAGGYFRYFYGTDKLNKSIPVFRVQYRPFKGADIILGQLFGQLDHALIEPIYGTDNYFSRNPEYGMQVRMNLHRFRSDTWISWDRFILPGDPFKEEISGGICSKYFLTEPECSNIVSVNLQGVVHHFGGQVDYSGAPLETRFNIAPGIEYSHTLRKTKPLHLLFGGYIIQSADRSSVVTIPYRYGYAAYTYGMIDYRKIKLAVSYFHGEYYFSPLGDPLFQSYSTLKDWYYSDTRNLINAKLLFDHKIHRDVHLGLRFESYYDVDIPNLDFSYGINLRVNTSFLFFSHNPMRQGE